MANEVKVQCAMCEHTWVAAYLPMEMDKFAKVMKAARCPKCAATPKNIRLAKNTTPKDTPPT